MNYYCDRNMNAICRVCLEKSQSNKEMFNIFDLKQGNEEVTSMIMACASVQVSDGDCLPSTICNKCLSKLNVAWQFKVQCESSDAKLRQFYFGNSQQLQVAQDLVGFNFAVKREYFLPKDESPPSVPIEDSSHSQSMESHMENGDESAKTRSKMKLNEQKIHQCDTCGKTFTRREYLTQHIRIHTGEKPYLCHLCEKRFVNSGHLSTHMRTHTGEKPHTCSVCPKAFSTKQELNKHLMVHKGERPYVCKMCEKRFGSSSNLYSHLRHHTGEKNFKCDNCGKAFYTKQEVKQHYVIHTGEKPFVCECCDKKFSQMAHLKRHAKLHKNK